MEFARPSIRLLAALLLVAIPPLAVFATVSTLAPDTMAAIGVGTALLIGAGITVVWAALVAVAAGRLMAGEARSMLELAERGLAREPRNGAAAEEPLSAVQRRLAGALEERNRQIEDLAAMVRETPIVEEPTRVARSMASAARKLTGDPTWVLVVLRSGVDWLPPGTYPPDEAASEPVGDVHGWASTLEAPVLGAGAQGARHAIGPWGAFVIVDVAAGEEVGAILMAPWEGRSEPSPAELGLLSLVGQHAATTIEHALLYSRLRDQTDELNRLAAVQTDFLRGVTHDLQTPLTSIAAAASELKSSAGLDEPARLDLDTIAHQADRLRRMVGQLLTVSRLEAGALTPRQEVFREEPIVRRTWQALRADRPLSLTSEGSAHLMVGDPDRVEQVLWAVLDNAVKYSPAGSSIEVQIVGRAQPHTSDELVAEISVTDHGSGMDAETRSHAFDQFYRSADARRLAPDGSGVGLYAARGLLRAMRGDIAIDSRLGAGTIVTISLPAEPAEDAHADENSKATPEASRRGISGSRT
jgi:two-component system sensor histidine kinase KdpD